jgi:hypothetical protein
LQQEYGIFELFDPHGQATVEALRFLEALLQDHDPLRLDNFRAVRGLVRAAYTGKGDGAGEDRELR